MQRRFSSQTSSSPRKAKIRILKITDQFPGGVSLFDRFPTGQTAHHARDRHIRAKAITKIVELNIIEQSLQESCISQSGPSSCTSCGRGKRGIAMNRRIQGIAGIFPMAIWIVLPVMNRRFKPKYPSNNFLKNPSVNICGNFFQRFLLIPTRSISEDLGHQWWHHTFFSCFASSMNGMVMQRIAVNAEYMETKPNAKQSRVMMQRPEINPGVRLDDGLTMSSSPKGCLSITYIGKHVR